VSAVSIPGVLKVSEAAEIVGVSEWTIRKEIAAGNLTVRRIGRITRILDEELTRWLRDYSSSSSVRSVATASAPSTGGSSSHPTDARPGSDADLPASLSRAGTLAQATPKEEMG
jgi:excisionase family DNA binding protein